MKKMIAILTCLLLVTPICFAEDYPMDMATMTEFENVIKDFENYIDETLWPLFQSAIDMLGDEPKSYLAKERVVMLSVLLSDTRGVAMLLEGIRNAILVEVAHGADEQFNPLAIMLLSDFTEGAISEIDNQIELSKSKKEIYLKKPLVSFTKQFENNLTYLNRVKKVLSKMKEALPKKVNGIVVSEISRRAHEFKSDKK